MLAALFLLGIVVATVVAVVLLILWLLRHRAQPLPSAPPTPPPPVQPSPYKIPDQFSETTLASTLGVRLMGTPADGSRAKPSTALAATAPVIWVDKGDEVLVHLESAQVRMLNGTLLVSVDLETDQTGRSPLVVALAMGAANDPAGLVAVTDDLPQGNGQLASRWGRVLQDAVWGALIQLVRDHALERGLAPRSLTVTPGQLSFQPGTPVQATE
jgi:hypothetical protein